MSYEYEKKLVKNAQTLRKDMTAEEKRFWYDFLKKLPFTVNRQKNIGNYIVDFYIASRKCVIEIDGRQHDQKENEEKDRERTDCLQSLGLQVYRVKNEDIRTSFHDVCNYFLSLWGLTAGDLKL